MPLRVDSTATGFEKSTWLPPLVDVALLMPVIEATPNTPAAAPINAPLPHGRCAATRTQALLRSKAVPCVMNRVEPEAMAW
jgi:hypothetical protein